MELKDYEKQKLLLESKHKQELALLAKAFALSNNKVNIGDIITTKSGNIKIEVEKIGVGYGFDKTPECIYYGKKLTKNGTQSKRDPQDTIYQSQLNS